MGLLGLLALKYLPLTLTYPYTIGEEIQKMKRNGNTRISLQKWRGGRTDELQYKFVQSSTFSRTLGKYNQFWMSSRINIWVAKRDFLSQQAVTRLVTQHRYRMFLASRKPSTIVQVVLYSGALSRDFRATYIIPSTQTTNSQAHVTTCELTTNQLI